MYNYLRNAYIYLRRELLVDISNRLYLWKVCRLYRKQWLNVLLYHDVSSNKPHVYKGSGATMHQSVKVFEAHLSFLKQYFKFIGAADLRKMRQGELTIHDFDQPPLLLTFDDGYAGVYENALPICRKLDVPFIVFVNTAFIDDEKPMWVFTLSLAIQQGLAETVVRLFREEGYGNIQEEDSIRSIIRTCIDYVAAEDLLTISDRLHGEMEKRRGTGSGYSPLFMTAEQVKEIDKADLVEVGDHGWRHLNLANVSKDTLQEEIKTSRGILQQLLGRKVDAFSFPFARFSDTSMRVAKEHYDYIYIGGRTPNCVGEKGSPWVINRCYSVKETDNRYDVINSIYV